MNITQATRAHYAALQHRPTLHRVGLDYEVTGYDGQSLALGTVWVKASSASMRKANMTKLTNRLRAMYPFESKRIHCEYRKQEKTA